MSSKKKSSSQEFNVGDTVLHKMRGYPSWPGKIVAHESISGQVLREKPRQGLFHCVRYFPKGDHSWAAPRDLKMLETATIEAYLSSTGKKTGELLQAYETAKDPSAWEAQQKADAEAFRNGMDGPDEIQSEQADEDEDELDEDEGGAGDKRKRKASDKKAANGKKVKTEKDKKTKAAPASKNGKTSKVKSSANVESEEDDTKDSGHASKATAPAPSGDGETDPDSQKVKEWRHKLQRAFLGKLPPAEKDMATANDMFTTIENYDSMTIQQLQISKIGKVMRKIAALTEIPREDEFKFKQRAHALIGKWQIQLTSAGTNEEGGQANGNGNHDE